MAQEMSKSFSTAIETGDVDRLGELLGEDPALATRPIPYFDNPKVQLPPLHLVCDAVFRGFYPGERALAAANLLLDHGVDANEVYAKSGDSYLIAAASLGAELVGLRLLKADADVQVRGLFGATALHWSALMGLDQLSSALLRAGAEIDLEDRKYKCTPLQWALHEWTEGAKPNHEGLRRACTVLIAAGARVPAGMPPELGEPPAEP